MGKKTESITLYFIWVLGFGCLAGLLWLIIMAAILLTSQALT